MFRPQPALVSWAMKRDAGFLLPTLRTLGLSTSNSARTNSSYWRDAATVIVAAPSGPDTRQDCVGEGSGNHTSAPHGKEQGTGNKWFNHTRDFDVLMLKRGKDSAFMPNKFVYPGGVKSEADSSLHWAELFSDVTGRSMEDIIRANHIPGARPPALAPEDRTIGDDGTLPAEIALKICAIRETFEESGLLLASTRDEFRDVSRGIQLTDLRKDFRPNTTSGVMSSIDVDAWRRRVEADAAEFLVLCQELDAVPNIWALYEWSNWLTPCVRKVEGPPPKPKRFDTIFYLCCLNERPESVKADSGETTVAEWKTPTDWFTQNRGEELSLGWPQVYETQRLIQLSSCHNLTRYIRQREPLGLQRWMETFYECSDGIIATLPGDDLYPEQPDVEGLKDRIVLDKSIKELLMEAKQIHRGLLLDGLIRYMCNIQLPHNQVSIPVENITEVKAKL